MSCYSESPNSLYLHTTSKGEGSQASGQLVLSLFGISVIGTLAHGSPMSPPGSRLEGGCSVPCSPPWAQSCGRERVLSKQTKGKPSLFYFPLLQISCGVPDLKRPGKSKGCEKGKHPEPRHAHALQMTAPHAAWRFQAFTAGAPQTGNFCEAIISGSALCGLQSISGD